MSKSDGDLLRPRPQLLPQSPMASSKSPTANSNGFGGLLSQHSKASKLKTNQVIVTTLPFDSLRWMKMRRKKDSNHRVALSHFREGQLREVFEGLDFDERGMVALEEIKMATKYVEQKYLKKKSISINLSEIEKDFMTMDEDGNGVLDYHEFMLAMTGTSKNEVNKASEEDIESLRTQFLEYGLQKKRDHFIKLIEQGSTGFSKDAAGRGLVEISSDYKKYRNFLNLFGANYLKTVQQDEEIKRLAESVNRQEEVVRAYVHRPIPGKEAAAAEKQVDYIAIEGRFRDQRLSRFEEMTYNPETRDRLRREFEARRFVQDMRKPLHHVNNQSKQPHHATAPLPALSPTVTTSQGDGVTTTKMRVKNIIANLRSKKNLSNAEFDDDGDTLGSLQDIGFHGFLEHASEVRVRTATAFRRNVSRGFRRANGFFDNVASVFESDNVGIQSTTEEEGLSREVPVQSEALIASSRRSMSSIQTASPPPISQPQTASREPTTSKSPDATSSVYSTHMPTPDVVTSPRKGSSYPMRTLSKRNSQPIIFNAARSGNVYMSGTKVEGDVLRYTTSCTVDHSSNGLELRKRRSNSNGHHPT